jgi:hypothetical protein
VIARTRKAGDHHLGGPGRRELAVGKREPQHAVVRSEVQRSLPPRESASAEVGAEPLLDIGIAIVVGVAEADDAERRIVVARTVDRDEDVAVRRDGQVPRGNGRRARHEVGDDRDAESVGKRDAGIVRVTYDAIIRSGGVLASDGREQRQHARMRQNLPRSGVHSVLQRLDHQIAHASGDPVEANLARNRSRHAS